ncbi:MAG: hypothetical protein H6732_05090 [Alphaproteobacteria bacterium]|nr:hypothetical protein [Alphaproteobacteria bacterium]
MLVASGATSTATASPARALVGDASGVHVMEASGAPWELTPLDRPVRAAATLPGDVLLAATDEAVLVHGAFTGLSGLTEALTPPVRRLQAAGGDLWVQDADGLALWRDGWLHRVLVDDAPVTGPVAADAGRAWVGTSSRAVLVSRTADGWAVADGLSGGGTEAVAWDLAGTAWVLQDGTVWQRVTSGWVALELPEATDVLAHPRAVGAWIDTAEGWWHATADTLRRMALDPLDDASVDDGGRLVGRRGDEAVRVHPESRVVLAGLEPWTSLDEPVDVLLVPTRPESLAEVRVTLDGAELEVLEDPLRVRLTPGALEAAVHTLAATATWLDGARHGAPQLPFLTGDVELVTWEGQIRPLLQDRCGVCHENGTETILASKADFVANLDAVIDAVSVGRMPLAGAKLTPAEVDLVVRWQAGGTP